MSSPIKKRKKADQIRIHRKRGLPLYFWMAKVKSCEFALFFSSYAAKPRRRGGSVALHLFRYVSISAVNDKATRPLGSLAYLVPLSHSTTVIYAFKSPANEEKPRALKLFSKQAGHGVFFYAFYIAFAARRLFTTSNMTAARSTAPLTTF